MDDRILAKLQALLAKTVENGCTQEEAASAAAKVQQLLDKHELTMDNVQYNAQREENPIEREGLYTGGERKNRRTLWEEELAATVAMGYYCRILVSEKSNYIAFVGRKHHREIAVQVFQYLYSFAARQSFLDRRARRKELKSQGVYSEGATGDFRETWYRGFNKAIWERLQLMRKETRDEAESTGTDLVRLNTAETEIKQYMQEKFTSAASPIKGRQGWDSEGYRKGQQRGKEVGLHSGNQGLEDTGVKGILKVT